MNSVNPPPENTNRAHQQRRLAITLLVPTGLLLAGAIYCTATKQYYPEFALNVLTVPLGFVGLNRLNDYLNLRKPLELATIIVSLETAFKRKGVTAKVEFSVFYPPQFQTPETYNRLRALMGSTLNAKFSSWEELPGRPYEKLAQLMRETIAPEVDEMQIPVLRLRTNKIQVEDVTIPPEEPAKVEPPADPGIYI